VDFAKLSADKAPCPEELLARLGVMYICMYYNTYVYIRYVCMYVCVCMHVCMCVRVCVCVYMHYYTIDITELDFFFGGEKTKPLSDVC
jgi:hypothetical protein